TDSITRHAQRIPYLRSHTGGPERQGTFGQKPFCRYCRLSHQEKIGNVPLKLLERPVALNEAEKFTVALEKPSIKPVVQSVERLGFLRFGLVGRRRDRRWSRSR